MSKVRRKLYYIITIILIFLLTNAAYASNNSKLITPNYVVLPCPVNGKNKVLVTQRGLKSIHKRLGIFISPGSTAYINESHATTIANNANFTLFPELFSLGYERSITAGYNIGWSKTNNTRSSKEIVILKIYDIVKATDFDSIGGGNCRANSTKTYHMTRGWEYDLR